MEKALFAAGCFWGVEAQFRQVEGVEETAVGYAGGATENPAYEDVCTGRTGHAEVLDIAFDPAKVTYAELVDLFFKCHNPTTLNRQGPDRGTQYRSAIFCLNPEQETTARAAKAELEAAETYPDPVVTEITPAPVFYRAEEYHQRYHEKHGHDIHCHTL